MAGGAGVRGPVVGVPLGDAGRGLPPGVREWAAFADEFGEPPRRELGGLAPGRPFGRVPGGSAVRTTSAAAGRCRR